MIESEPLASREYWERIHQIYRSAPDIWHRRIRYRLTQGFYSHLRLVRTHILEQYLPRQGKMIELGCAPSEMLLEICMRFGLEPFGIEYSESGYRATVKEFERKKIDSSGIMQGDLTDPEFRHQYREYFDVVYSGGLIEHFSNPIDIVGYHVELLKPGGSLVVSIPNLRAPLYRHVLSITDSTVLAIHNLDIMKRSKFESLFSKDLLCTHYSDYIGVFDLNLMFPPRSRILQKIASAIQGISDVFLVNILRYHNPCSSLASPHLLYVGTKRGGSR